VDPGRFSRLLAYNAMALLNSNFDGGDLRAVMDIAHRGTDIPGGSTLVLARLLPGEGGRGVLEGCNLGDSGYMVFRNGRKVFESPSQSHGFNMPYQFAQVTEFPESDTARDAEVMRFEVQEGDVVVAGSDGLWDNLWDHEIADEIIRHVRETTGLAYGPEPGTQAPAGKSAVQSSMDGIKALGNANLMRMMDPAGLLGSRDGGRDGGGDAAVERAEAEEPAVDLRAVPLEPLAERLSTLAQELACDESHLSPIISRAKDEGQLPWQAYLNPGALGGGKMDDVTAVVSVVVRT